MQGVSNRWRPAFAIAVCLTLSAATPFCLKAQDAAAVAGTVLDQSGRAIPAAVVAVKNESTGAVRKTTTDADGHFSVSSTPVGSYTIEVAASGFATNTLTGLRVAAGTADALSIALSVANLAQTVTVEAS